MARILPLHRIEQAPIPQDDLLSTKLHLPRVRHELVPRPHLLAYLDKGSARAATLLAAPAGWGKTTLLAMWQATLREQEIPLVWLSLDAGDNDPAQFCLYVSAALDVVLPGVYEWTRALLQSIQSSVMEPFLTALINRLNAGPPKVVLVLDDCHLITNGAIHQGISFLLEHMPPNLHLVLASRVDPPFSVARLRVRGQLAELRAADLRFTAEESAAFLREVMGLRLSPENVAAIEARTEGWVAGLQLAALALQGRTDQTRFIQNFSGSNRYVVGYLLAEVLANLSEHLHSFLLQTAILHRLCGPLCDAVIGVSDVGTEGAGYSQVILEELERTNLFIVPLDDEQQWYRYHHLFAQALRRRLAAGASKAQVAMLRRRACAWFEACGSFEEATEYALEAQDFEHAARLTEQVWPTAFVQGALAKLRRWLDALPQQVINARPSLAIYTANVLALTGQRVDAEIFLDVAEQALQAQTATRTPGDINNWLGRARMVRAFIATRYASDPTCAIVLGEQGLALLAPDETFFRGGIYMVLGLAYQQCGELSSARYAYESASALGQAVGHHFLAMAAMRGQALVQVAQGLLQAGAKTYARMLAFDSTRGGPLPTTGFAHVGLAEILYQRNDLAGAMQHVKTGLALGDQGGIPDIAVYGSVTLARIQQAHGDGDGAYATLREALQVAPRVAGEETVRWVKMLLALAQARAGHMDDADGLADEAMAVDDVGDSQAIKTLALARIKLMQLRPFDALNLLAPLLSTAEAEGRTGRVIEISMLQALAQDALGRSSEARARLRHAVMLAEPEDHIRIFLDEGRVMQGLLARWLAESRVGAGAGNDNAFLAKVLAAYAHSEASAATATADPLPGSSRVIPSPPILGPHPLSPGSPSGLTEREVEVLRLVAHGLTNKGVAERLIISPHTVNMHLRSIYGKLNVATRAEATRLAVERNLV